MEKYIKTKLGMDAEIIILKRHLNGNYVPMTEEEIEYISVGGFKFVVDGQEISFDFSESSYGFNTETGSYNCSFSGSEIYTNAETLTAKQLASVEKVNEFFVLIDTEIEDEITFGDAENNADPKAKYKLVLKHVQLSDVSTGSYAIQSKVLEQFNSGNGGGSV